MPRAVDHPTHGAVRVSLVTDAHWLAEPPRIFLSYAAEDKQYAQFLREALTTEGAQVWTPDELNLVAPTAEGVQEAMRRSHLFLVLVTRAAIASSWVQDEIDMAQTLSRSGELAKVVPLILEGVRAPPELDRFRAVEVRTDDWARVARHLVTTHRSGGRVEGAAFEKAVRSVLAELDVSIQYQPAIAGLRPDFVVTAADGRAAVIEVKAIDNPSVFEAVRAQTETARAADAIGAQRWFTVFRSVSDELIGVGITDLRRLAASLRDWLASAEPAPEAVAPTAAAQPAKTVFVAMPFKPEYDDLYWIAARHAADAVDAVAVRLDQDEHIGDIAARIHELIVECSAVIADLSESNPNVLYEVGYAHALDRPTVLVCSTPLEELPFDVRNINTLAYTKGAIRQLLEPLERRLRAAMET